MTEPTTDLRRLTPKELYEEFYLDAPPASLTPAGLRRRDLAALRDACFAQADREAAARLAPVGELTEAEVAEAYDELLQPRFRGWLWAGLNDSNRNAVLAFIRRLARPAALSSPDAARETAREVLMYVREQLEMRPAVEKYIALAVIDAATEKFLSLPVPAPKAVRLSDGSEVTYSGSGPDRARRPYHLTRDGLTLYGAVPFAWAETPDDARKLAALVDEVAATVTGASA